VGALANIAFVVAFLALLRGFWSAYARGLSRRVSIPCVLLGAAVILPLALGGELKALYPGYGLWISSFYALALAARQHSMNSELVSQLVNQRALGVEPAHSLDSIVGAADR
jgi:hypothetical protein